MAAPKEPPISIRLTPDRLEKLEAFMVSRGIKRHPAIIDLIDAGMSVTPACDVEKTGVETRNTPEPPQKKARALAKPKPAAKPTRPADDEWVPASPPHIDTSMVPFNPTRAPMQKQPKTKSKWSG